MTDEIKLTQFSKGGGCGCKIAPSVLQQIIKTDTIGSFQDLLVGNESADDAAVYQINGETAVISTADFFMPIVDDAFQFGRIAAANAISDVYAMGGTPLMAIALLGWPIAKVPVEAAQQVLEGGRAVCREAGIPLAGGHTIDTLEPMFGLAVTGTVATKNIKQNNTARVGDQLFLTKPLGTGLLTTALKRGLLQPAHYEAVLKQITTLNKIGAALSRFSSVHAMTDVTGFGLLGHLLEMAAGSNVTAHLHYGLLKKFDGIEDYIEQRTMPGATARNWASYGEHITLDEKINEQQALALLPDPQTNGGLLIAVAPEGIAEIQELFRENGLEEYTTPIGTLVEAGDKRIVVLP
ncbi:MAG TPA: selenide, water dikinase SelD [Chitinophagaceae bacterium]|nr:selenide, water dikinase SelD [Chitinophagaceae bacterium]